MSMESNEYMKWKDIMEAYPESIVVLENYRYNENHALDGGVVVDTGNDNTELALHRKWTESGRDVLFVPTFIGELGVTY